MTAKSQWIGGAVGEWKGEPDEGSRNPSRYRGGVSDGMLPSCFLLLYV